MNDLSADIHGFSVGNSSSHPTIISEYPGAIDRSMAYPPPSQYQKPPFTAEVGCEDPALVESGKWLPGQAIPMDHLADIHEFLCRELFVPKLNDIHKHLLAGRLARQSAPPPLARHGWKEYHDRAIFVKPLPVYTRHVAVHDGVDAAARGLLLTYAHLVVHESDFALALQHGLLPRRIAWIVWCRLQQHPAKIPRTTANKRYQYGQLRLTRLNLIYRFGRGRLAYFRLHRSYTGYFGAQYRTSLILFAYVTVVQSGLQTILNSGEGSTGAAAMARTSVQFGVLTVGLVVISVAFQFLYFLIVFLHNLRATLTQPHVLKVD
ncbi:hypothetical protein B0H16DRAFT_1701561 [Mycena metata]|uniref:Uncharacterized protein n=1 Tax=Mycena metata TaxID=1033252 RepID=A0AAD7HAM8_9AGAR|nr:hypothetical protein B0H16DRAFT_1701561 [Mycena metata]